MTIGAQIVEACRNGGRRAAREKAQCLFSQERTLDEYTKFRPPDIPCL